MVLVEDVAVAVDQVHRTAEGIRLFDARLHQGQGEGVEVASNSGEIRVEAQRRSVLDIPQMPDEREFAVGIEILGTRRESRDLGPPVTSTAAAAALIRLLFLRMGSSGVGECVPARRPGA